MLRTLPREQLEDCIHYLANKYPACFFEEPRMRRPLKKSIASDLEKDGVSQEVMSALSYYMRNWGYQNCLQAGVERVDLDGKKAGVVTEQEHMEAQQRIRAEKAARMSPVSPVTVVQSLHAAGKIPTDQLRKIDAPPMPSIDFNRVAEISQSMKAIFAAHARGLSPVHREGLDAIAGKLAKILAGNAKHSRRWADLGEYCALIARALEPETA
jgi:hypothetical protein